MKKGPQMQALFCAPQNPVGERAAQTIWHTTSPVGASLLAKAVCQSTTMLNISPHSRAGSLPQVGVSVLSEKKCQLILPLAANEQPQQDSGFAWTEKASHQRASANQIHLAAGKTV